MRKARKAIEDQRRATAPGTGWALCVGAVLGAVALRACGRFRAAGGADVTQSHARRMALVRQAQCLDHDLRGPVGAMAVALELVRTASDADTRDEAMQVLERQVVRMTTLTERVRALAQALEV